MILRIGRFLSKDFSIISFFIRSLLFIFKLLLPHELSSFYLYLSSLCPRIISLYYLFHYFFHTVPFWEILTITSPVSSPTFLSHLFWLFSSLHSLLQQLYSSLAQFHSFFHRGKIDLQHRSNNLAIIDLFVHDFCSIIKNR